MQPAGVQQPAVVNTQAGLLAGRCLGDVHEYLGVPYAAPPVGPLRWRRPQPVLPWAGVRSAHTVGPSACQALMPEGFGPWTHEFVTQGQVSEDCLYLNIWAPARADPAPCPVLVWIHGGAFMQGAGSIPIYNGRALAEHGVVVVTINYRLGALGFFQHPDLALEASGPPNGNFGLMDQLAALAWVQQNIAAFGGDPQCVTLAGQSAGAVSVHALLGSPQAAGLFHRAIAMSGPPALGLVRTLEDGQALAAQLRASDGPSTLADLRALPAQSLLTQASALPWFGPVIDGELVPAWPPGSAADKPLHDVPVLVGQTADELSGLDPRFASDAPDDLQRLLRAYYGEQDSPAWQARYAQRCGADVARTYRAVCTDRWLLALWAWAKARQGGCQSAAFVYHFEHVMPGPDAAVYGSFHTSDVPYAFMTLDAAPERAHAPTDHAVSQALAEHWVRFMRTGNPNPPGAADWPALDAQAPVMWAISSQPGARPMFAPAWLQAFAAHVQAGGPLAILP